MMKEIDPIAEIDYTVEPECTETDHIVGIGQETTIKMTKEVTIGMTIEINIEEKIIGISKNRDIREDTKIIIVVVHVTQ